MKNTKIRVIIGVIFTLTLLTPHLSLAAQNNSFCSRSKTQLFEEFNKPYNRIAFDNEGGIANGGVCWWHSRLQRSAIYLSTFAPEKPKPTLMQAIRIIKDLTHFNRVVTIPGYYNFSDFSRDFQSQIQAELEEWQIRDGFINQRWLFGLSGKSQVSPKTLRKRIEQVFSTYLTQPAGVWVMAQMKGITSHALLVIGMKKNSDGYDLDVIDSNYPSSTHTYSYHYGDQSLRGGYLDNFVPYVNYRKDFTYIDQAVKDFCAKLK